MPTDAVTIDVLKAIEARLTERGFLPEPRGPSFSFLWFIAETERNVFLWRNGMSIADADRFEFWVNLPGLIEKRLRQLQLRDSENPFINPLWGVQGQNGSHARREVEYLQAMKDLLTNVIDHAHAISRVGSILRNELSIERAARDVVVLPQISAAARV